MSTRKMRSAGLFVFVLLLMVAFTGAAFAQDDAAEDDAAAGVPECFTGGEPGVFGKDCQAFTVNTSARPTGWAVIQPGEAHVYRFAFSAYRDPGSDDDANEEGGGEDASEAAERNIVTVTFKSDPRERATLTFYTADQFRSGGKGFGMATVGERSLRGDNDDDTDEDTVLRHDFATWQGNLSASGTYYAVVRPLRGQTGGVMYNIEVHGGGVRDFTFTNE